MSLARSTSAHCDANAMTSTYLIPTNTKSKLASTHTNMTTAGVYSIFMLTMVPGSRLWIIFMLALLKNIHSAALIFQAVETAKGSM